MGGKTKNPSHKNKSKTSAQSLQPLSSPSALRDVSSSDWQTGPLYYD
jgi:hypothetical protein